MVTRHQRRIDFLDIMSLNCQSLFSLNLLATDLTQEVADRLIKDLLLLQYLSDLAM